MKRKSRKVSRLSPNEEAQLVQEELQRRRKVRLQQVREQERYIALQVRREVQERKERELQNLAVALQDEWQKQKGQRIQTLEQLYKESLQEVGQAHRSAKQNEPNWDALAMKREENEERAAQRHQKALRELTSHRQAEKEQRNRPVEARKKALKVERERAAKIASLPHPAPNPIESIGIQTPLPPKTPSVQHYSITHHHHILESAVDRETDIEQPDAEQAATLEAQRVEELEREEVRDRQEQLEKARLRGDNALRKERVIQDRAKLLSELGRLQQADLQRRRHLVNRVPVQIFQPLYRHDDLRNEQQRELEIAFQDLCTEEKELKGDLVLAFESEPLPLPVPSITSHSGPESDLDLDLSFDPNGTPCEEAEEEPAASSIQPIGSSQPVGSTGRLALRRLLERIRTQRDQWSQQNPPEVQAVTENTSTETGSLNDREWQQASSLEEGTADTSMPQTSSKVNEDSIVAESMQKLEEQPEEQFAEAERRVMEEELKSQQQEQLALLLELTENQRSLERQLEEAQQHRQRLQDMLHVQSGTCSEGEEPNQPQDLIPTRSAEVGLKAGTEVHVVKASAPLADSTHAQRLEEYQQRLLKQNRIHRQSIEDAFRRLEEYKQTLKLRHAAVSRMPPPLPSLNEETSCPFPSLADRTLATTNAGVPIPHETPVENTKRSYQIKAMKCADTPVIQPPLHSPMTALTTHSDLPNTLINESSCSQSEPPPEISSLRIESPISASEEEPLPPPSVILERLLSARSATCTQTQVPLMSRPLLNPAQLSEDPVFVSQDEVRKTRPVRDSQVDRNHQVREQIRIQRDALQALLRAEREKEESGSLETPASQLTPMDAQLEAFEKTTSMLPDAASPSQSLSHTCPSLPSELCESMSGSRLKQPVSYQARPLHMLLQDLEQHKLSTIQEVDTPANVTLDTATEAWMERSSCSDCSSSSGTPIVGSNSSRGLSAASEVLTSESGTAHGKASRLSWRETLQLESAASHADNRGHPNSRAGTVAEKRVMELELALPHARTSVEPDYLSSTTLSTGTYSTSEHDPNCTITDSSLCSNESVRRRAAASLTWSSSLCDCELPRPRSSTQCSGGLQHIIEKYTKEMDRSLRSVLSGGNGSVLTPGRTGNTALSLSPERDAHTGVLAASQHLLENSNSLSTTMHDTFQSLAPEMTNNESADCSMNFHLPVNEGTSSPLLDDSSTHTASSEWLDCGLPAPSFSADDKSATGSTETEMDTSLWKWILRTESASSSQQRNSGLNHPEASLS